MERGLSRRVTIVLVTWNSARTLPRCLDGVAAQEWPEIELIAVDNASSDASAAIVKAFRSPAAGRRPPTVLCNGANAGFSKAVNQAIAEADGEFVLLLNPDAYLERDYVEKLVAAFDAAGDGFGAATGRLMRGEGDAIAPTGVVDSLGIRMTRSGRHLDVGQGSRLGDDMRGLREIRTADGSNCRLPTADCRLFEVFGVSGAAAMYRMSFVRDVSVGGEFLDEDFFAFREDADLAWRGRLFGWRALHVPDAVAYHVRRVTPERRRDIPAPINMHSVKNRFLLRLKNEGAWLALRNAPFEIFRDVVALGAVLTIERSSLPALAWLWRNRRRVLEKRREIQRRRRISDRALAGWFR